MHVILFPELAQYQNKAMGYRLIFYPIFAFGIFISRKVKGIKKGYPYYQDILISLVITLDMLGNTFGLYGSIEWWDDIMHLINCALITPILLYITSKHLTKTVTIAFYAFTSLVWLQVMWEIAEYITFMTINSHEIINAYRDTIGDLVFGQLGSIIAIIVMIKFNILKGKNEN